MLPRGSFTGIIMMVLDQLLLFRNGMGEVSRGEMVERYAYGAFGRTRIFDAAGGEFDAKQAKEDQEMYRTP